MITAHLYAPCKNFLQRRNHGIDSSHELDLSGVKDLPYFAKTFLKPGGFMVILILSYMFSDRANAFKTEAFFVTSYPDWIVYTEEAIRETPIGSRFPNNITHFCLIATKPVQNPEHFTPNDSESLGLLQLSQRGRVRLYVTLRK